MADEEAPAESTQGTGGNAPMPPHTPRTQGNPPTPVLPPPALRTFFAGTEASSNEERIARTEKWFNWTIPKLQDSDQRSKENQTAIAQVESLMNQQISKLEYAMNVLSSGIANINPPVATGRSSAITNNIHAFKRSAYERDAPFDLENKTGYTLYEAAQVTIQPSFDGKPLSLQPFVNGVKTEVLRFQLLATVTITSNAVTYNILEDYGQITEDIKTNFFTIDRACSIAGFETDGTPYPYSKLGVDADAQLKQARNIQDTKILFYKIKKSLTNAYLKQILSKLQTFGEDGTQLLLFIIQETQSTSSAAMRNASTDLNTLNFKNYQYDIDKLHTAFDALCATLRACNTNLDENQKVMYLLQAYETCDNAEWSSHVYNMKSSASLGQITSATAAMENAKTFIMDLKRNGKWKKEKAVSNPTTFNANGGQNAGSTQQKFDKHDRSLSKTNTLHRNGRTYNWCTGPGHGNKPMWAVHDPGTCSERFNRGSNNSVNHTESEAKASNQGGKIISKDKFNSELKALFADDTLDVDEARKKIEKLVFN